VQVTGILSWIVRSWTDVENNIVSVERVKEYADTAKEVSIYIPSLLATLNEISCYTSNMHDMSHDINIVMSLSYVGSYCFMNVIHSLFLGLQ
jgi:hypothetical protein